MLPCPSGHCNYASCGRGRGKEHVVSPNGYPRGSKSAWASDSGTPRGSTWIRCTNAQGVSASNNRYLNWLQGTPVAEGHATARSNSSRQHNTACYFLASALCMCVRHRTGMGCTDPLTKGILGSMACCWCHESTVQSVCCTKVSDVLLPPALW
jgi:hypothetical protein